MRRVIGFLGSLGLGLMLAAAGLAFDVATLFYSGLVIFALMAALWLWSWARPIVVQVPVGKPMAAVETEPAGLDSKGRTLFALRKARDSASIARACKSEEGSQRAYHEIEAALLSVKREFGFGPLKWTGDTVGSIPYLHQLECYVAYVDRIYPLLREGHIDEARAKASAFKWTWGQA